MHPDQKQHPKLKVTVRYVAATKPFEDENAEPRETLGSLKSRAMTAFGLQETEDNNQKVVYWLYQEDTKLEDLTRTLGDVADDKHHLKLRLVQQIIQG